ncbi:MAG: Dabb family protein [Muribaculaceae bacterium]|nr:Dabb family protein [Muribaculaceae bacterium]MDE5712507.1 Dabb family protein [Muribaculaceae bacterium]
MVKHIVTFKFKGSDEQRQNVARQFAEALIALPDQIEELKSIEVGINQNPKETWDLVLTATAESLEDVAKYSAHPAHVAAVQIIAPYKEDRACVDYTI